MTQGSKGVVSFKGQNFYTRTKVNQDCIFTIAVIENKKSPYSEMVSPDQIDTMIKSKLNELTALEISEIQQKKIKKWVCPVIITKPHFLPHHAQLHTMVSLGRIHFYSLK